MLGSFSGVIVGAGGDKFLKPRQQMGDVDELALLDALLKPNPGTDVGRICALESQHYMRNQLLRDADWAGMAHSIEIRTPLVDVVLLKALAPAIANLAPGAGKAALAKAPARPLPDEIAMRAKSGFNVPLGQWMNAASLEGAKTFEYRHASKGAISRQWSRFVLSAQSPLIGKAS